jgi:hypothetical protein
LAAATPFCIVMSLVSANVRSERLAPVSTISMSSTLMRGSGEPLALLRRPRRKEEVTEPPAGSAPKVASTSITPNCRQDLVLTAAPAHLAHVPPEQQAPLPTCGLFLT